jgi:predicted nuclease of predicted toxin-antitoxin system
MKLLFDQNLSFKLCQLLADVFPNSNQIRLLGMEEANDRAIWEYAKANGFILVSQDADFADMATLYGPPPKVIWLRCGNQPTNAIEQRLRDHGEAIAAFEQDHATACWEIY